MMSPEDPISVDPHVMGGMPVFRGTRLPIAHVLNLIRSGYSLAYLQEDYPYLTAELVQAALRYDDQHPEAKKP